MHELSLNDYQTMARTLAMYREKVRVLVETGDKEDLIDLLCLCYSVLGLAGEAGELANKLKKVIRDKNGIMSAEAREDFSRELGDTLWYQADVASNLGIGLTSVGQGNLIKLQSRAERGVLGGSGDNR